MFTDVGASPERKASSRQCLAMVVHRRPTSSSLSFSLHRVCAQMAYWIYAPCKKCNTTHHATAPHILNQLPRCLKLEPSTPYITPRICLTSDHGCRRYREQLPITPHWGSGDEGKVCARARVCVCVCANTSHACRISSCAHPCRTLNSTSGQRSLYVQKMTTSHMRAVM